MNKKETKNFLGNTEKLAELLGKTSEKLVASFISVDLKRQA